MLNRQELEELAKVAIQHDLLVIADEIYAELVYDEDYTSLPSLVGMKERTILISGFSKGFAMTGWRLGFVCAPPEISGAMLKIHQYAIMCAPTMAQYAALEALKNGRNEVDEMVKSYRRRRNYIVQSFNEMAFPVIIQVGHFMHFLPYNQPGYPHKNLPRHY